MNEKIQQDALSFWDHLDEVRTRMIKVILLFFVICGLAAFFFDGIWAILQAPVGRLVFISPQEAFLARLKVLLLFSAVWSVPYVLYHFFSFIRTGLHRQEQRYLKFYAILSFCLFWAGLIFGYTVILPVGLKFLLSFSTPGVVPMISLNYYLDFVTGLLLTLSVTFQLPLMMSFLTQVKVISPQMLVQQRRFAFVGIIILGAVLTPPDVITQLMVAAPLVVLYEIGILCSRCFYRGCEK